MKTKRTLRLLSMLLVIVLCAGPLAGCGRDSGKKATSVSFPKTVRSTYDGEKTVTHYTCDRTIGHEDGCIEVRGTMEIDGEECSVQWLYTPEGTPIGSREMQQSGQTNYVFLFDNYYDFIPGEDGVVKVEDDTVYYEGYYDVYEKEDGIVRRITTYADNILVKDLMVNELGQLTEMKIYDSNGEAFFEVERTYTDVPVE